MMATIRHSSPSAWADAFAAANFNALADGAGILSTAGPFTNGSGLDLFADLSFIMVTSTISPTIGGLDFYLLPLLHDGSTYPDNENTGTAANQPTASYFVRSMLLRTKASSTQAGGLIGIPIPPGTFNWYVINRCGVTLPSSSVNMTCKHRFYSRQV